MSNGAWESINRLGSIFVPLLGVALGWQINEMIRLMKREAAAETEIRLLSERVQQMEERQQDRDDLIMSYFFNEVFSAVKAGN